MTPERAAKARARARAWYNANPDRVIARARAWKAAHPDAVRRHGREWHRRRAPVKVCASSGCMNTVETLEGQKKFCKACSAFYRATIWREHNRRAA